MGMTHLGYDVNAAVGINYDLMDPAKKYATQIAVTTVNYPVRFFPRLEIHQDSYGESALVYSLPGHSLHAHVTECLGTKDRVAQGVADDLLLDPSLMLGITAEEAWECVGQDNLAMVLLDLATRGAHGLVFGMFLGAPEDIWFTDDVRFRALCNGTREALKYAGCAWGGGEMPVLKGTITSNTIVLAGSATGAFIVDDKRSILSSSRVEPGQAIIFMRGDSVQANGISGIRSLASDPNRCEKGWATMLPHGETLARAVLRPTPMYCRVLSELVIHNCDTLRYAVTISGHGLRKLMRAPQPMRYVIEELREPAPIFRFLQAHLNPERPLTDKELASAYCSEAGFVVFCTKKSASYVASFARGLGFDAWVAGYTEASDEKEIVVKPRGYTFGKDDLDIR